MAHTSAPYMRNKSSGIKNQWTIPINAGTFTGIVRTTSSSASVTFDWGDGSSNIYAGTSDQAVSHTYATSGAYKIKVLDDDNLTYFRILSNSNAQFQTDTLPRYLTIFNCSSTNSALTGDIAYLPAGLVTLNCYGNNSALTGDIAYLPAGLINFYCSSNNSTLDQYTPGRVWHANMQTIQNYNNVTELDSTGNDNLLIDLALTTWAGSKLIKLGGTRTSVSDAAVATLNAMGVTVTMYA